MSRLRTVLLTDDEPHIRKFVSLVVKPFGNPRIIEAGDGAAAVAAYEQERPDLVLLDVNMPVMDGLQALEEIRRRDPGALVVMLTSLANRQTVEACLRLGAADYLRKDTPREELSSRFAALIADCFDEPAPEAAP